MWRLVASLALLACAPAKAQRQELPEKVAQPDTASVKRYGLDVSLLQTTGHVVACYVTKKKPVALACVAVPVARPIER